MCLHGWGRWVLCHPLYSVITLEQQPYPLLCSGLYMKELLLLFTIKGSFTCIRGHKTWCHVQTGHYFLPLHCLHADWDRDQPSLPFKSHKTINLTSTDHPILLGSSDKSPVSSSLNLTSHVSMDTLASKEPPTRTVIVSDAVTSDDSSCLIW